MTAHRRGAIGASPPASQEPAIARWWQTRTARERTLLMVGAVVLVAFAAWTLVLAPALHTVTTAHTQLPALRADAARAAAMALDAQALRAGTPMLPDIGTPPQEQLRDWLQRIGLDSSVRVSALATDGNTARLQLDIDNADAAQLIRWLGALSGILPVTIVEAALARTVSDGRDLPGRLSGTVLIQASTAGGSP